MKLLGAVNHRPTFFAQISHQISRKIPRPEKTVFAHNFGPDFEPVLAQPAGFPLHLFAAPLKPQGTGAPLGVRLLGTPLPTSLIACTITWRLATITCVIKMKDKGREKCSQNRTFFRYKTSRMRICSGCGTKKEPYTTLLQWGTFLAKRHGGSRQKMLVVEMVSLVFIGFLQLPQAWKGFYEARKRVPNDFLSVVVVYAYSSLLR